MQGQSGLIEWLLHDREPSVDRKAFYYRSTDSGAWTGLGWEHLRRSILEARDTLAHAGAGSGSVVGLLLPTCITWEIFHIACLDLGAVVVGLDTHDLGDNFRHIVDVSEVSILVVDAATSGRIEGDLPTGIRTSLRVSIEDEQSGLAGRVSIERGIDSERPTQPATWLADQADEMATVVFTSGSTGKPKGIAYSLQQLMLAVESIVDAFPQIDAGSKTVCWLPLSNLFQRVVNLCAMRVGAPVYFVSNPRALMRELPGIQPTVLIAVPRFFEKVFEGVRAKLEAMPLGAGRLILAALTRVDDRGIAGAVARSLCRRALGPVRAAFGGKIAFFISGSAPMPEWLLRNFDAAGMPILEAYGLSENIVPIACNRLTARRRGSVGFVLAGNDVRVAGDGELLVRGPGVCRTYVGTNETVSIDAEGFLATGDYAEIDADGFVWLRGRKSDVFKTNTGRRISPVEIEAHILDSGVVDHAVVLGAGRKFLVALVTVKEGMADQGTHWLEDFRAKLATSLVGLPPYKQPAGAVVLTTPFSPPTGELTANLKLKRRAIEAKYLAAIDALYESLEIEGQPASSSESLNGASFMVRL